MFDSVCERYGQLPSAVRAEDTYVFRMLRILDVAGHFGGARKPVEPEDDDGLSDLPVELL